MKPRIGIMSRYLAKDNRFVTKAGYIYAISAVGGLPIQIPIADIADVDAIAGMVDGIIITGGADVTPLVYGEQPVPAIGPTCGANDRFEIALIHAALAKKKPVLGIYRGIQVINVAFGGTLYQDIPSQISRDICHNQGAAGTERTHSVAIEPGSYMHGIAKCDTMLVNSFHHQALNTIGDGLKVSARAMDGVVEAVENADGSVFAVQWHPELLYAENPEHRAIFETFVNRCAAK